MSQSINLDAILYFPIARFLNPSLAIPHFSVKDLNWVNPERLKMAGFRGVVFDKDNTLTAPYVNNIYPTIKDSFDEFKRVFGEGLVIMSNSAGTKDDKDYSDAKRIEKDLGISVLIHDRKKPGGISQVMDYFGFSPEYLAMVGDRIFTDIVFGNRYGMLTIHTALLTEKGDNKTAAKIRRYELPLIRGLKGKGKTAPPHRLFREDICSKVL